MSARRDDLFRWLGGGLFVAALARTAWAYAVEFGTNAPGGGTAAAAIDVVLFTAFALHHSLFARTGLKNAIERRFGTLTRPVYVWVASLLLLIVCGAWRRVGGTVYDVAWPAAALLAAVQMAGLWLTIRGVRAIDPLELAGIRQAAAAPLQQSGAYAFVRHPLYFGWLLMTLGTPHMTGDRLTFALVSNAYLALAIPWEERSLEREYGEAYASYKRRVRWRMVPFVY